MAKKLSQSNSKDFWSDISKISNNKTPVPTTIGIVNTPNEILDLLNAHFKNTFNCISKQTYNHPFSLETRYNNVKVSNSEMFDAIKALDFNKSCGIDGIYAEHLKYASKKLIPLLSLCFSSLFVHGILPKELMSIILVPIINNKYGSISLYV